MFRVGRQLDGTGFSMPDTPANHRQWPYAGGQKPGCGFPTGKLVGLFCLHTGRLLCFAQSSWKSHDLSLADRLLAALHAGEVLLADRAYCSWTFLAQLLAQKVDFVMRLHQGRTVSTRRYRSWSEVWKKPQRRHSQSLREWKKQPAQLRLRLVRFHVHAPGFRTKNIIVVTSLLDKKAFPDSAIAQLYMRRWQIELHYRQIKTNLALDVLRGRTPQMIERELEKRLRHSGCNLERESGSHSIGINPHRGMLQTFPRLREMKEPLAWKILKSLGAVSRV